MTTFKTDVERTIAIQVKYTDKVFKIFVNGKHRTIFKLFLMHSDNYHLLPFLTWHMTVVSKAAKFTEC